MGRDAIIIDRGLLPELVLLGEGLLVVVQFRPGLDLSLDLLRHLLDLFFGEPVCDTSSRDLARKALKIKKQTTHDLLSWRRIASTA